MKKILALTVTVGFLTACSQSGSGSGSDLKAQGQGGDPTTQQFQESYQLKLNGCDTGKHVFGSNSSYDDVKRQLCEALQDDELNSSCAEPLRKDFFDKKCSGMTWTPKYKPVTPSQPSNPNSPVDSIDSATQEKVRTALTNVLADKYETASNLTGQEKQATDQLAEDMMSCGLSYLGPKCLDYETLAVNYGGVLDHVDGKYVFYSELKIKGTGALVAMVFKVDQVQPSVKSSEVEISKIEKPRNGQSVEQYLKDSSALSSLVKISLASDFQAEAAKRLQSPRDIRELYHVSKMLLEVEMSGNNYLAAETTVVNAFSKNKALATETKDVSYQEAVLAFITSRIELKQADLIAICEVLLNSTSKNVKEISATFILDAQPNRTELKPTVLGALNNQRWDIRKKAISALSKVQKTTSEENQLLQKIGDSDGDVRKEAAVAAAKIGVTDDHFETVKRLSNSANWEVRLEASKLLSRINSAASLKVLIEMMSDSDSDVRKQLVTLIGQKNLTDVSTPDFAKQLNSPNWEVRRDAASFLGKVGSDQAILILIGKMDDSDSDVRANILKQLSAKDMKDSFVQALSANYASKNWEVRRDVSTLLGKNTGSSATKSLIAQMNDSDGDVRVKINSILDVRTMSSEMVGDLANKFSSQNWEVRREVAKLLGKIKTQSSLSALEDQLVKETDGDVKSQIVASIKAVKG